jgi:hypothetical protein
MASPEEYKHSFRRWVAYRRGDKIETRLQRGKNKRGVVTRAARLTKLSLPALIVLSWNFGVSDRRDMIFALLGVSRPLKGISAYYSKSITEVFTDMARSWRSYGKETQPICFHQPWM